VRQRWQAEEWFPRESENGWSHRWCDVMLCDWCMQTSASRITSFGGYDAQSAPLILSTIEIEKSRAKSSTALLCTVNISGSRAET